MIRRPPRSTRTDTLFPYTTLFRSCQRGQRDIVDHFPVRSQGRLTESSVFSPTWAVRLVKNEVSSEPPVRRIGVGTTAAGLMVYWPAWMPTKVTLVRSEGVLKFSWKTPAVYSRKPNRPPSDDRRSSGATSEARKSGG